MNNRYFFAVELVERRATVLGQRVVDPLPGLHHARLAGGAFENVREKVLEVLVRHGFLRRHDVVAVLGLPEKVVHAAEAAGVPLFLCNGSSSSFAGNSIGKYLPILAPASCTSPACAAWRPG